MSQEQELVGREVWGADGALLGTVLAAAGAFLVVARAGPGGGELALRAAEVASWGPPLVLGRPASSYLGGQPSAGAGPALPPPPQARAEYQDDGQALGDDLDPPFHVPYLEGDDGLFR